MISPFSRITGNYRFFASLPKITMTGKKICYRIINTNYKAVEKFFQSDLTFR
jgi:hypothetical protein